MIVTETVTVSEASGNSDEMTLTSVTKRDKPNDDGDDVFDFAPAHKVVSKDAQVAPGMRKRSTDPYTEREARKAAKRQEFLDIFARLIELA
jgi:hypothetical protein